MAKSWDVMLEQVTLTYLGCGIFAVVLFLLFVLSFVVVLKEFSLMRFSKQGHNVVLFSKP